MSVNSRTPGIGKTSIVAILACCGIACQLLGCGGEPESPRASEAGASSDRTDQGTDPRPNVLWIVLDAVRARNLSCYGYHRPTSPNIDMLAENGALFERAYVQGFGTVSSTASYLTGRYFAAQCLTHGEWPTQFKAPGPGEQLVPEIFGENGYATYMVSAHPFITPYSRLTRSFDRAIHLKGMPYASFEEVYRATSALLDETEERPFFLYLHTLDTHFPHRPPAPYQSWYDPEYASDSVRDGRFLQPSGNDFTEADQRQLEGLHDSSIEYADAAIGSLMNDLIERDIFQNTLIIIGADHGDFLGEDGQTAGHGIVTEEVWHVPLIISGPGIPSGKRVEHLVQNADIVPTLVDLLDLNTAAEFDGTSLKPWLLGAGTDSPPHEYILGRAGDRWILRTDEYQYHWRRSESLGTLWHTPYSLADRRTVSNPDDSVIAEFESWIDGDLLPAHKRFLRTGHVPPDTPFFQEIRAEHVVDPERFLASSPEEATDLPYEATWRFIPTMGLINNGFETVDPLQLRIPIPDATYNVHARLWSGAIEGHPCSAMSYRAEDDEEFRIVRTGSEEGHVFVSLGQYTIDDQSLDLTLDILGDELESGLVLTTLRFIPLDALSETVEELEEREESLRALGYLQ